MFISLENTVEENTVECTDYAKTFTWDLQNNNYLTFNNPINFSTEPYKGVICPSNLVSYWKFDEPITTSIIDNSGNGFDGLLMNGSLVKGKYGNAASFDGVSSYFNASVNKQISFDNTSFTIIMWVYLKGSCGDLIGQYASGKPNNWALSFRDTTHMQLYQQVGGRSPGFTIKNCQNHWSHFAFIFDNQLSQLSVYQDGSKLTTVNYTSQSFTNNLPLTIAKLGTAQWGNLNATIDEIQLFNESLSSQQINQLYSTSPYFTPDPVTYKQYYNFIDPNTNNSLLVYAYGSDVASSDSCLIKITKFFDNNKIEFTSNATIKLNLWTRLGQPDYTNGNWNSENFTTTLALTDTVAGILEWNTYMITAIADEHSVINPSGTILFPLGASQLFTYSASSGYNITGVKVDGINIGTPENYTFSEISANHTISVISSASDLATSVNATNSPSSPQPTNQSVDPLVSILPIGDLVPGQNRTIMINLLFMGNTFNATCLAFQDTVATWISNIVELPILCTDGKGVLYATLCVPNNASAGNYSVNVTLSGIDSSGNSQTVNATGTFNVTLPYAEKTSSVSFFCLLDKPLIILVLIIALGITTFALKKSTNKRYEKNL